VPKPLAAISRKPKQETFGLIPDDGFVSLIRLTPTERIENDEPRAASEPKGPLAAFKAYPEDD
jgi:hypothetical protein